MDQRVRVLGRVIAVCSLVEESIVVGEDFGLIRWLLIEVCNFEHTCLSESVARRIGLNEWASASPDSLLEMDHALEEVVAICRAAVESECRNRTGLDPVVVTLPCHFCNHHVWVSMLDAEATEGMPSNCHRDVGFVTFFGTQVIGFADGKSDHQERRYQRKLDHDEAESCAEGDLRDGKEVNEHDSCLRAANVGVARGSVDGMCLSICRL